MKNTSSRASIDPSPRLVIDRSSLAANYDTLNRLTGTADVAGVVKADSYGLGADALAPVLHSAGCRTFFVANCAEGERVRTSLGPGPDIFVLNGFWPSESERLNAHTLCPVLNSPDELADLRTYAPELGFALHFDTGISRLGFSTAQTSDLFADAARLEGLSLKLVMSHLACADTPEHPLNAQQLHRFRRIRSVFSGIPASLANSAGILLGEDYHFDLVRPGIGLYGGAPSAGPFSPVLPVARIDAPILQVRELEPGDTVGYGAEFTVDRPLRTATVNLGYADGILRACHRATARIHGKPAPLIGRVSMDLIAIDISAAPQARAGDSVSFLGEDLDAFAAAGGAANYELLVRLGSRFQRVYL